MDLIEGLPLSGNANAILVMVDKYTKFAHFVPLKHLFTAATVFGCLWTIFTGYTGYLNRSYLIGIGSLLAGYGNFYFRWLVFNYG